MAQLPGSKWRREGGGGGENHLSVAHTLTWRDDDGAEVCTLLRLRPNVILTNGWWVSRVTYAAGRRLKTIEWRTRRSADTVVWRIGAATRTSVDYLPCAYCTSNPPQVEVSLLYSLPSPCRACLLRGTQHILAWNNNNQKHNHSAPLDAGHK